MPIERERKFLLNEKKLELPLEEWSGVDIKQGYLMLGTGQQLRIRLIPENYEASICYKSDIDSTSRNEYEYDIPYDEGLELYESAKYIVEKRRYPTLHSGNFIDIDVYPNGLKIVEIEYKEGELKVIPEYCGKEVTGEIEYTNIYIAMNT